MANYTRSRKSETGVCVMYLQAYVPLMKFGLKVHHTDIDRLMYLEPEAIEVALFHGDIGGEWVSRIGFDGPIAVHAPEKFADGTILDAGADIEAERARAMDMLRRTIDLSAELQADLVICHPGGVFRERKAVSPESLLRTVAELQAYAGDRVELVLENMPCYYRTRGELWHACLFTGAEEISDLLDDLKIGLCLDVCHAKLYCNATGTSFEQYIEALLPYARHLHVSDAAGIAGEGLQIGEGEIDWQWLTGLTKCLDIIAVPEIEDGFREGGKGFKVARDRLAHVGLICG